MEMCFRRCNEWIGELLGGCVVEVVDEVVKEC